MAAPYQSYPSLNMLRDDYAILRGQVDQLAQELRSLQQELARADLERVKNLQVQTARQLAYEERQRRTADGLRDRQFRALIDHLFQSARDFFARQQAAPDQ
jgi:hypothetical protein